MQTQRTLYGGWVDLVARGGNDHDGGDGYSSNGGDDSVAVNGMRLMEVEEVVSIGCDWWYEGGGGDQGSDGGDDEVLVWCTRSSDGDGGDERRLSLESDRKKGSDAGIL
ncbi:hypothetical protein Tco_0834827 [Tanacetum coccineum]